VAVGVGEHVGVHDAAIKPALHGNRLTLGDHRAILAAGSGIHQRTTAGVLHHELVAKDLRDIALDGDRTSLGHLVDR
jgi:hypothetical protein